MHNDGARLTVCVQSELETGYFMEDVAIQVGIYSGS
jgi:hypothetical protein